MKPHRKVGTWTFLRQWLKNPLRVAAVAPSSAELAAAMIAELPDDVARVIELGGGTGAITRALLEAGIRDEDLLVLELNEELHAHLHLRFPRVPVLLGDARELAQLAGHYPALKLGPAWWFHDSPEGMRRFRAQVTETAGFYNTVGFNDDTRAFLSIPARHDVARRIDCGFLAELVLDHRLEMDEAAEVAVDLAYGLAKKAYRL